MEKKIKTPLLNHYIIWTNIPCHHHMHKGNCKSKMVNRVRVLTETLNLAFLCIKGAHLIWFWLWWREDNAAIFCEESEKEMNGQQCIRVPVDFLDFSFHGLIWMTSKKETNCDRWTPNWKSGSVGSITKKPKSGFL